MNEYQKQANDFLTEHGLIFKSEYVSFGPYFEGEAESRSIYLLTLTLRTDRRRRYSTRFGASVVMTNNGEEPTAYDLLTCITKSDPGSFEDFCSEYGYDNDSRSAERIYRAVKADWNKVEKFFTAAQIEQLQEIN